MRKGKSKAERLPWYRARNYKGSLTEAQKRQLDAFRAQPKHPATAYHDLPEEVQRYIVRIEGEVYDSKQDGAVRRAFVWTVISAALLYLNYEGCLGTPTIWAFPAAALVIVAAWIWYWREWDKNAEEFLPPDEAWVPTDEGIRQEWEVEYISQSREAERESSETQS